MTILKKVGLNAVMLVQLLLSVLKPGIFYQLLFDKYVFLYFIGFSLSLLAVLTILGHPLIREL